MPVMKRSVTLLSGASFGMIRRYWSPVVFPAVTVTTAPPPSSVLTTSGSTFRSEPSAGSKSTTLPAAATAAFAAEQPGFLRAEQFDLDRPGERLSGQGALFGAVDDPDLVDGPAAGFSATGQQYQKSRQSGRDREAFRSGRVVP